MAHRCHICLRTDSPQLALNREDLYQGRYRKDERYPQDEICDECDDIINETLFEFDEDEETFEYDDDQDTIESGDRKW